MKKIIIASLLFCFSLGLGAKEIDEILIPSTNGQKVEVTETQLEELLEYTVEKKINLLYLLKEVVIYGQARNTRFFIKGDTFLKVLKKDRFDLGTKGMAKIVPYKKVKEMELGIAADGQMSISVNLINKLELDVEDNVKVKMDKKYGARTTDIDGLYDFAGLKAGKWVIILGWQWADIKEIEFDGFDANKIKVKHSRGKGEYKILPVTLKN